ncbi:MAG TPA: tRNA pseudouridine(38-40) synthase TruA [Vicinamibacterales bacterium]
MRLLKLTVAYDGTGLVGWQRQATGTSVQGLLEEALTRIDGQSVAVAGAGRTDAGVHALAQVASCAVETSLPCDTLRRALNAVLPAQVRVLAVEEAAPGFHARFSAHLKHYQYLFVDGPVLSPFVSRYAWHVLQPLDTGVMDAAAQHLVGTHDFSGFQSTGSEVAHAVRTVVRATVAEVRPPDELAAALIAPAGSRLVALDISADGFLRHMVRAIAGTLADIGMGRRDPGTVRQVLQERRREAAGATAPAHGLWLLRVDY